MSPDAPANARPRGGTPLLAAAFMIAATLCYAINTIIIRAMGEELNAFMIGFLRNGFGLLFLLPFFRGHLGEIFRTRRWGLHGLRSAAAVGSGLLWFWALPQVPVADAIALYFTAPIFVALAAVLVLGERMALAHWLATMAAFVGVLVVLRPGFQTISLGLVAVLVSAAGWATMLLVNKILTRTDTTQQIVLLNLVLVVPPSLVLALLDWQTPRLAMVALGATQGLLGTSAHYFTIRAFRMADASYVMPFDFLRLPFGAIIAFFVFAQIPDPATLLGAVIIFAATFAIATRRAGRAA